MKQNIPALTGVRGIAALWVWGCHASIGQILHLPSGLSYFFASGWMAVELFFLLSGFIMVHAHQRGAQTLSDYSKFMGKRAARIFPVHFAVLLVYFLVIGPQGWGYGPFYSDVLRHITLTHAWWNYSHPIWHAASWSLSAEWGAYLLFPLCFMLTKVKSPQKSLGLLIAGTMVYTAITYTLANANMQMVVQSGLLRSVPCMALGILLYRLRQRLDSPIWIGLLADICSVVIPLVAFALNDFGLKAWLLFPFIVIWLFAVSFGRGITGRFLQSKFMVWLGSISFSLYMTHSAILYGFFLMASRLEVSKTPLVVEIGTVEIMGVSCLLVAWLVYSTIELPLHKWLTR